MTNPELTRYVKNARDAHTPEEVIRSNLKANGWSDHDIDESLNSEMPPLPPKKFPLLVVIIPILIVLAGGSFWFISTFLVRDSAERPNPALGVPADNPLTDDASTFSSAEWKQFEDPKLQLTFDYPVDWTMFDPHKLGIGGTIAALGTSPEAHGSWARPIPENESFITFFAKRGTISERLLYNKQLEQWIKDHNAKETDPQKKYSFQVISSKQLEITRNKVTRYEWSNVKGALMKTDDSNGHFVAYYFQNTDFVYILSLWTSEPLTETNRQHIKVFDKMAETVRYKTGTIEELTGIKPSDSGVSLPSPAR